MSDRKPEKPEPKKEIRQEQIDEAKREAQRRERMEDLIRQAKAAIVGR